MNNMQYFEKKSSPSHILVSPPPLYGKYKDPRLYVQAHLIYKNSKCVDFFYTFKRVMSNVSSSPSVWPTAHVVVRAWRGHDIGGVEHRFLSHRVSVLFADDRLPKLLLHALLHSIGVLVPSLEAKTGRYPRSDPAYQFGRVLIDRITHAWSHSWLLPSKQIWWLPILIWMTMNNDFAFKSTCI